MGNTQLQTVSMSKYLAQPDVNQYVTQMLGERKGQFVVAMTTLAQSSEQLRKCDRQSILACGLTAVGLNLELNPSLGFCYAVPYGDKAQFQVGYKGLLQLAIRTNQYKNINAVEVYENQFRSWNALTEELDADFTVDGDGKVVGYAAMFEMLTGYRKTIYWSKEKVLKHAKKFSKTFSNGPWSSDFDGMAKKTLLKQLIGKWGIMSSEMQTAITKDQSITKIDYETGEQEVVYPDNASKDITEYIKMDKVNELLSKFSPDKIKPVLAARMISDVTKIPADDYADILNELSGNPKEDHDADLEGTPFAGLK